MPIPNTYLQKAIIGVPFTLRLGRPSSSKSPPKSGIRWKKGEWSLLTGQESSAALLAKITQGVAAPEKDKPQSTLGAKNKILLRLIQWKGMKIFVLTAIFMPFVVVGFFVTGIALGGWVIPPILEKFIPQIAQNSALPPAQLLPVVMPTPTMKEPETLEIASQNVEQKPEEKVEERAEEKPPIPIEAREILSHRKISTPNEPVAPKVKSIDKPKPADALKAPAATEKETSAKQQAPMVQDFDAKPIEKQGSTASTQVVVKTEQPTFKLVAIAPGGKTAAVRDAATKSPTQVKVGSTFPNGEKVITIDYANGKIITNQREYSLE